MEEYGQQNFIFPQQLLLVEFNEKLIQQVEQDGNFTELQRELNRLYEKQNYPTKQEMEQIVEQYDTTVKKVANWFKQKRRRQFLKGKLQKQNYKKNWFSNEQVIFLKKQFAQNQHPNNQEYIELAKKVKTTQKHIKNWFSHQRQKLTKIPKIEPIAQNTQQNYAILQQILQNMPLAQRLQLALGTGVNQNILYNQFTPYYLNNLNNQYMLMQYLQVQSQMNQIYNFLQNVQKNLELSPTATLSNINKEN